MLNIGICSILHSSVVSVTLPDTSISSIPIQIQRTADGSSFQILSTETPGAVAVAGIQFLRDSKMRMTYIVEDTNK